MSAQAEINNSDQGSHFTCKAYLDLLESCQVKISMDGKGQAADNARTERFSAAWNMMIYISKNIQHQREMIAGVNKYIHDYNTVRPHASLGGLTPDFFHQQYEKRSAAW